MLDVSSNPVTGTCTNVSNTNTNLRSVLNAASTYRGTTYNYPQKMIIDLVASCLEELGFTVEKNNTGSYYNHIVLKDYSDDICLQIYNSAASTNVIDFIYPRHISSGISIGGTFNNSTSCRAIIRMLGQGPGKTKTLLIPGSTTVPSLTSTYFIYFTEAKCLLTGEMKKAIILVYGTSMYFKLYDEDWKFLPGYVSTLTSVKSIDSYSYQLTYNYNYSYSHDPYISYKLFQEQTNFPEIPLISNDGMWEFPDVILNPYGEITEGATSDSLKYSLATGNIYQIGNKKYILIYGNSYYNCLFRLE